MKLWCRYDDGKFKHVQAPQGIIQSMSNNTIIGESGTNKNLPPYYALTYIIKY